MNSNKKYWYKEWFDSPYYHILYQNRDNTEAQLFLNNIIDFLSPNKESLMLDAACGKGRHSIFLASKGFTVHGFDLSPSNIQEAKKNETDKLKFFENDIRIPLNSNHYDYVFNLFTSFGYFDDYNENFLALNALNESLKSNGILILDFMNVSKVVDNLTNDETIVLNNITFNVSRKYTQGYIVKSIRFSDAGRDYNYEERVKAIDFEEFKNMFSKTNLAIQHVFGDYNLSTFDAQNSDRLIIIARKNG